MDESSVVIGAVAVFRDLTEIENLSAEVKGLRPGKWHFTVSAHKPAYVECWTLSNEAIVGVPAGSPLSTWTGLP